MIDSIYDGLQTVLDEVVDPVLPSNIWNFDETGHKIKYVKSFLYGLRGATKNNAESSGLGEHVTVGAFANVAGCFLDPVLLFTGAESNKASMQKMVEEAGFENALVLMKKGKASMDDKLFSVLLDWFANCLNERGFTGKHILFIDNRDSHERSQPIQVAMRHNIILMTFPSHCTHLVQMLDLSFFKPLKQAWKQVSAKWVEEESTDLNPYISKPVFVTLFYRAWCIAAKPEHAINGWKKMGLSEDKLTGLLRIDRAAIPDRALAASDKYDTTKTIAAKQSVRLCVSTDGKGNSVFEDFDFDLSQEGLKTMMVDRPELYAMYEVTKTYLLSQPGMAMKQPTVKPSKIAQTTARLLTDEATLEAAQAKDVRKAATIKKKKTTALAQIGNELGVTVMVNGVDVVEEYNTKGTRKHYCPYCKMTLTRPCSKKKCNKIKNGKKASGEGDGSDGDDSDGQSDAKSDDDDLFPPKPPLKSILQVDVVKGKGRLETIETFFCTVMSYEDDGAVFLTTQDGETMNIFLDDYFWKRVYQCIECKHYGVNKVDCDACGLTRASALDV
jgi:hypothetical protein